MWLDAIWKLGNAEVIIVKRACVCVKMFLVVLVREFVITCRLARTAGACVRVPYACVRVPYACVRVPSCLLLKSYPCL